MELLGRLATFLSFVSKTCFRETFMKKIKDLELGNELTNLGDRNPRQLVKKLMNVSVIQTKPQFWAN